MSFIDFGTLSLGSTFGDDNAERVVNVLSFEAVSAPEEGREVDDVDCMATLLADGRAGIEVAMESYTR